MPRHAWSLLIRRSTVFRAKETGATPAQVSVAWVRERDARTTTPYIPIIGPRNTHQLEDYLGALAVELTDEQYTRLTEVSAIPLGVPYGVNAGVHDRIRDGDASLVDQPPVPLD
ncbi:aldo/keto reductase [Streptomyces sp. NPDC058434]|uniref:aldo/keto reductase n=1 Tax=Streptomyces sp. NPDC058434 TaxID=3346498 RepID=UPI003652D054